jgi:hypothetical protein
MDVTDIAYLATDLMARRHAGAMRVEFLRRGVLKKCSSKPRS